MALWFSVVAWIAGSAVSAAEPGFNCVPAAVKRLTFSRSGDALTFRATFPPPPGNDFDPTIDGLWLEVSYEPETDAANVLRSVTLPPASFRHLPHAFAYSDPSAAIGGVSFARITLLDDGRRRIVVRWNGNAVAPDIGRALRFALATGDGCARTCSTRCSSARRGQLTCRPTGDTTLCGVRSGCEVLNVAGGNCLLPYPSSFFESEDSSTPTGRRIAYGLRAMPANSDGVHIDPAPWRSLDGFSPGATIIVNFPQGVDLAASKVPPATDLGASLASQSPTVLLDADSGERIEHFGEVDVSTGASGDPVQPPTQAFMIRPGRRLKNAGHYIVALRGLVDVTGSPIDAEPAFRALRDATPSRSAAVEARRLQFEGVFDKLAAAGVTRGDLILAWDFHTASDDALERWLLSMRDETFAQLGDKAPVFQVDSVEDDPLGDPQICRRVRGTYDVPLYTTSDGPGSLLNIGPEGVPVANGVTHAPFTAIIPCSLVQPMPRAGRPIFYGHGLLGSGDGEITASNLRRLANTYGFVLAATDWQGFSQRDRGTVLGFIGDLGGFRKLPERSHQGILNQLVLGHLLGAADGLSAHPAFQYDDGTGGMVSVIDPTHVYWYGISQGGILGGVVMALAQETTRGVLGVPAANFSTLLQRSVDFDPFFVALRSAYPNDLDRAVGYPLIQQLWDRAEPNGWYHHTVAEPLPSTPAHKVLVHMATGDAEVANLATEIMVRSMGIPQVAPPVQSYFDIPEMTAPFDGSAMVESDGGFPPAPITNVPPARNNAHEEMRARPAIQAQIDRFLRPDGLVENFCDGPCDPE